MSGGFEIFRPTDFSRKMSELTLLSSIKVFDGKLSRYTHNSTVCACTMTFAIFLPDGPNADINADIPVRNVRRFGPADP